MSICNQIFQSRLIFQFDLYLIFLVRQQPAEKSQSQSTRVTRRSARLRKTEKTDKHENIDSEDSSEKTDSDEEVNGQELENDSSSPEDDTPLIHLKDDSPPPKVPKKEGPRAEELNETEPKIRPEVKLKKTEDNDRVEDMKIEKSKTENHKTKSENQTQKRKSPSPTNETVQNGDEKRTDANSNQEKQVSTPKPHPNLDEKVTIVRVTLRHDDPIETRNSDITGI